MGNLNENVERVAYSPKEFSAIFGKGQNWAYRMIYAQKVKAVRHFGNMMIPAGEVDRIIQSAEALPIGAMVAEGKRGRGGEGERGRGRPKKL